MISWTMIIGLFLVCLICCIIERYRSVELIDVHGNITWIATVKRFPSPGSSIAIIEMNNSLYGFPCEGSSVTRFDLEKLMFLDRNDSWPELDRSQLLKLAQLCSR